MSAMNRSWVLTARPKGDNFKDILEWREEPVPKPGPGEALIRNIYISMDPAMRIWMTEVESYYPPVPLGDAMHAMTIGVVVESNNPELKKGDIVSGIGRWSEYYVVSTLDMGSVMPWDGKTPLSTFVGTLGPTGFTAYFGLMDVGKPKPGETVLVSGAAGAVGTMVGQIAKIKGCRVVGIAGSDEKCAWLKSELGFDKALNYRTHSDRRSLSKAIRQACPDGVDIYWENVGGYIAEAAFENLAMNARIPLCGMISKYNDTGDMQDNKGPPLHMILMKRARIQGFLVLDYYAQAEQAVADLAGWIGEGKLKGQETVIEGIENAVDTFHKLFTGGNTGKLMVRVAPEDVAKNAAA